MKIFKKPLLAFLAFVLIQLLVSVAIVAPLTMVTAFVKAANGGDLAEITADPSSIVQSWVLATALILSSIITIFFMQKPMKMVELKNSFAKPGIPAGKCIIYIIAAFVGIFATDILSEIMDLPNLIEAELGDMSKTVLGVLAIGIIGPLAEEVVFRGSIMGHFLKNEMTPAKAIFWSSLLFGIMHMNPAQIPFAMIVGLILGVFYWKTSSLVLPCIIHMVNNSISCLLSNVAGEDFSLVEMCGGTMSASIVAVICAAVCIGSLYKFVKE